MTGRSAGGSGREGVFKENTFSGDTIKVGGLDSFVSEDGGVWPGPIVTHNDDDIWSRPGKRTNDNQKGEDFSN